MEKIALGCDHGGFALMQEVKAHLDELGLKYEDFGTYSEESGVLFCLCLRRSQ